MGEVEVEYSTALVLPASGVVVDLTSENEVAIALQEIQRLKAQVMQADRRLREALAERSAVLGTKTMYVDGVGKLELKGSQEINYDAGAVEEGLRALGCPEEVIREIVVETVTYKVDGRRAATAGRANPEYQLVIEEARTVTDRLPTVSISSTPESLR